MSIHKIYGVMNQLENQSSKKSKEQILKNNEGNMEFREALNFLLNPYIVTGISTKKMNKEIILKELSTEPHLFDLSNVMSYLIGNNTGKDINVVNIQSFIKQQESDEIKEFVKKFVTKDLKLGISEKTVNKVYGKGTIPSFAVMLAESYAKKENKVTGTFYITLKLDGNRCIAISDLDGVKFFTRKGQLIEGMKQLEEELSHLPIGNIYDGELLLVNKDDLPSDELFRATQKVVRKDGEKKDLEFHIFDTLRINQFKNGKSEFTYSQRRSLLDALSADIDADEKEYSFVKILPVLYKGTDKTKIAELMEWAEASGYEGLMVNTADGLYLNKRTDGLLKVKTMKTADLLVMNIEESIDGQFKGLLGRVNVEYKDNSVGVGSGFTLEQRKLFVDNPDLIVGKIIEVSYFEESKDEKTQKLSLRFPIFKGIREDKDIEDVNYGE